MANVPRPLDLIAMGRTIVDVYGDQVGARLEDVSSFSRYIGGCPANIAIGTARLGLCVGLITRVGDDQNGRYLREGLAREGVDTRCVRTDPSRWTALAFLAIRDKKTFPLLHYRDDCADMAISPEDYSDDDLGSARALLVSGSHLTTPHARQNLLSAVARAKAKGTQVIFDIDYRPVFWGLVARDGGESRFVDSAVATRASQLFLAQCDLVVGTEEEIHVAGGTTNTIEALRQLRSLTQAPIVLKRGAAGCAVFPDAIPDDIERGIVIPGFAVEVFNVLGAGDGFLSGFLSGWLRGQSWEECGRRGNATGALVVSRHGCSPASPTKAELDWFLERSVREPGLHMNAELAYIHRATTRRPRILPVCVIAADHVAPLEALVRVPARTLSALKQLVASAALGLAARHPRLGILLDDIEGEEALQRIGSDIGWIGRKIEATGAAPLRFRDGASAAVLLSRWPRHHIIKCLVPMDDDGTRALQNERLVELYQAAAMYEMELLLEFVHPDTPQDAQRVVERIRATQALGVKPDWWKLPAFSDPRAWDAIERAIHSDNPLCRGILVLGGGRDMLDLKAAFTAIRGRASIQGFAVGRTLFMAPAAAWLAGEVDDGDFIRMLGERFLELETLWTETNAA
ncbi:5-dehydro-2-deoxygluconokinase [Variovorax sp. PBL-E5]|uniref:5-dehydro-2-deoxygluconokinase n=1 Tax=Variovorax sp. PBL-E5 TaxID=434014 RepID=UPI00131699D2|nr:5-dehydro-2-deoxygluconokinase [Variovorax sp. PBL-E5]VTU30190.1 5-dehydro-2-deoxygluconokinase [Variovorax sp. PBL-E5]